MSGGAAAVGLVNTDANLKARESAGMPAQPADLPGFDPGALRDRVNADGEFRLAARQWDADVRLGIGDHAYDVVVVAGRITEVRPARSGDTPAVRITGPMDAWLEGFADRGLEVDGDEVDQRWPYQPRDPASCLTRPRDARRTRARAPRGRGRPRVRHGGLAGMSTSASAGRSIASISRRPVRASRWCCSILQGPTAGSGVTCWKTERYSRSSA